MRKSHKCFTCGAIMYIISRKSRIYKSNKLRCAICIDAGITYNMTIPDMHNNLSRSWLTMGVPVMEIIQEELNERLEHEYTKFNNRGVV